MHAKSPKLLADIRHCARFILQSCAGRECADYDTDEMLRLAIERSFEIIGEALNRLSRVDQATANRISECPNIISFRNILSHGYDIVDHAVVWEVAQRDVPLLLREVEALLQDPPSFRT